MSGSNPFPYFIVMARFLVEKIAFDTRTLDNLGGDSSLAIELQNEWEGKVVDHPECETLCDINAKLDEFINLFDFTGWLTHEVSLRSLDIPIQSPIQFTAKWDIPSEFCPIARCTMITIK